MVTGLPGNTVRCGLLLGEASGAAGSEHQLGTGFANRLIVAFAKCVVPVPAGRTHSFQTASRLHKASTSNSSGRIGHNRTSLKLNCAPAGSSQQLCPGGVFATYAQRPPEKGLCPQTLN